MKQGFFTDLRIKRLRNIAGGDTYTIIYLKLILLGVDSDGIVKSSGLCDDFAEELALAIDEKPDDVRVTLNYLIKAGLAETDDDSEVFFPYTAENVGSEGESAARVRRWRERKCRAALLCDDFVTTEKEDRKKIPPYSPPAGGRPAKREHKNAPDWKPEAFEKLWRRYPTGETSRPERRGDKQKAIRAWEELHPDDELIGTILAAQARQARCEQWRDGVGIPHLSTYLNSYGWEEFEED